MEDKKKIIVICGPTASGKTGLSLLIAEKFGGEIISADSMQIYKKLDIGTAKATPQEQAAAPHHLVDIMDPSQPYNVQLFTEMAGKSIDDITSRGKIPVITGGTGLYIESLLNGIKFARQEDNARIKQQLMLELQQHGKEYMFNILREIDPEYAATVHPNNTVRVLRGIEVYRLTGKNMTTQLAESRPDEKPYDYLILGLNYRDRQKLYDNINLRVDIMMQQGILREAEYVYNNRESFKTCVNAIGYKEFFPYFEGLCSLEECVDKLKQASRNYAKRQLTWFNRMKDVNWLFIDECDYKSAAAEAVKEFLRK
ncbi:MAG: tRNA (adenosine(37)-N6)-dimethylallyltransferase MiaA [Oscillospiraceae bacterium]|nr:tRNA (adenosine(37)-N6)-dimethylallyltransferase MiaA [Oscillospiraceae bacterium]